MYKITLFQLRKPAGSEDNEAEEMFLSRPCFSTEEEVLGEVRPLLTTLGGEYGRWLEISVAD